MMKTFKVDVTAEDIRDGMPNYARCPIALAVERATGMRPVVTRDTIYVSEDNYIGSFETPSHAQDFIVQFDHLGLVDPFSFEMTLMRMDGWTEWEGKHKLKGSGQ